MVKVNSNERNYHIFYQLLNGGDRRMKDEFLIPGMGVEDFLYTRDGNDAIAGVSDVNEWSALIEAFHIMGFSDKEQMSILRTVAAVLLLGNVTVMKESSRADQATLTEEAYVEAAKACRLLSIDAESSSEPASPKSQSRQRMGGKGSNSRASPICP